LVPDQLAQFLAAQEHDQAIRTLHTLKGLAATVGANELASVAAGLEKRVRLGVPPEESVQVVETLRQAVEAAASAIQPVLQQLAPEHSEGGPDSVEVNALDSQQLVRDLNALIELLANSDMLAVKVYATVRKHHGPVLGGVGLALQQSMDVLDFATAHDSCKKLLQQHGPVS
jgi:two-component system sensor histidine kinase/response regulator